MSKELIESILPDNLKRLINENNSENLSTIAENLQINLNQVKSEINEIRRTGLNQIEPEIKKTENFISKINDLHKQIDNINEELDEQENLLKNVAQIDEYKNLIDQIEMINKVIIIFESLQEFELYLLDFKCSIDMKDYPRCYDLLSELTKLANESNLFKKYSRDNQKLNESPVYETDEILIIKELKEELIVQRERLWYELDLEWDKIIKITESTSEITIDKTLINQDFLNQLTKFSNLKLNKIDKTDISFVYFNKLKHFSKQFLKSCLNKIINSKDLVQIEINSDSNNNYLKFKESSHVDLEPDMFLESKLNQIEILIKFLHENLFKYKIHAMKIDESNGTYENLDTTLMSLFAHLTINEFVKLIYEQLIINVIPLKEFDFTLESKISQKLNDFEEKLRKLDYLKSNDKSFKSFMSNVEELYVRKKCKYIMENARNMMKSKDIFELVKVKDLSLNMKKVKDNNYLLNELVKLDEISLKTSLDETGLLKIPKFSISKLSKQILDLVNDTLNEAFKMINQNKQSLKSVSLLCLISRNLFDLYASVVPTYHANNLKDLPQLSAIVFNDFYFLSMHCLTLGHKYKSLLKSLKNESLKSIEMVDFIDLDDLISNFNFVDMVPKLYSTGYEILIKQIEKQEKNLIVFLNEDSPNGIKDLSEANNYELFKKSLQKCVYQLKNLSSIWIHVLSENLYYKVFGQLFDLILNDLVKSCLKLEDISSDDASYLHSAFTLIKDSVYDLFTKNLEENNDVSNNISADLVNLSYNNNLADLKASKYIKTWQKFKYMLIVLKAGLQEIVDLWSDSKGPLALYYDSEEIRHLIRALFMITDRRSAALAKIK